MNTGLFLSRDDGAVSETVDVDALSEEYGHLCTVRVCDSFFRQRDQDAILQSVDDERLDAVVLAGNSPLYFERVLGGGFILQALKERGINPNRIAMANIKEQVALPHRGRNKEATSKARLLIEAALARVEMVPETPSITISPRRAICVIGSGPGGIVAATYLLRKGYRVYLVERGSDLPQDMPELLPAVAAVRADARATLFLQTEIQDFAGHCGQYRITLATPRGPREIIVGGILVSAGDDSGLIPRLYDNVRLALDRAGCIRQESHLPGQTADPGIWYIPSGNGGDRFVLEASSAALAVLSLTTMLDRNELEHPLAISEVDPDLCGGCGTCVKTCAFSASRIDRDHRLSVTDTERCKGCGNCVTACPTGARDLATFPRAYVQAAIGILARGVEGNTDPKILAMFCRTCGQQAFDAAGKAAATDPTMGYSPNVMPLLMECGGNVDTQYVLKALQQGFDAVALFVCRDGHCHNVVGNTDMQRRLSLFRAVLRSRNIDSERLRIIPIWPDDGSGVAQELASLVTDFRVPAATV